MAQAVAGGNTSEYFESSINALASLAIVALSGTVMARWGLLENETVRKALSQVNPEFRACCSTPLTCYNQMILMVFMPCLLFVGIGNALDYSLLVSCVAAVVFALLHTAIGLVLGWGVRRVSGYVPSIIRSRGMGDQE